MSRRGAEAGNRRPVARICAARVVDVIVENDALHYAAEFGEFERMSSGETAATRQLTHIG
jgi:hypothetical protein